MQIQPKQECLSALGYREVNAYSAKQSLVNYLLMAALRPENLSLKRCTPSLI